MNSNKIKLSVLISVVVILAIILLIFINGYRSFFEGIGGYLKNFFKGIDYSTILSEEFENYTIVSKEEYNGLTKIVVNIPTEIDETIKDANLIPANNKSEEAVLFFDGKERKPIPDDYLKRIITEKINQNDQIIQIGYYEQFDRFETPYSNIYVGVVKLAEPVPCSIFNTLMKYQYFLIDRNSRIIRIMYADNLYL